MRAGYLVACAASALLATGCGFISRDLEVSVAFPPLPGGWEQAFGHHDYELRYTAPDGTQRVEQGSPWAEGCPGGTARLPARAYAPVLVTPICPASGVRLRPAGGIAPLDIATDGRCLQVSWERGAAAALIERLLITASAPAVPADALDVGDLADDMERIGHGDPWTVDADTLLASIVASGGRTWQCRALAARGVRIPQKDLETWAGVETYVWDDALASPVTLQYDESGEAALAAQDVAIGFHRLFPAPPAGDSAGSWLDLGVTEADAVWILRRSEPRGCSSPWAPSPRR